MKGVSPENAGKGRTIFCIVSGMSFTNILTETIYPDDPSGASLRVLPAVVIVRRTAENYADDSANGGAGERISCNQTKLFPAQATGTPIVCLP